MHTSSGVDNIDEYLETIVEEGRQLFYKYGNEERPVATQDDHRAVQDRHRDGAEGRSRSTARITARSSAKPTASGSRPADAGAGEGADAVVHAHQGDEHRRVQADDGLHTNSSNNTIFADADGNIAYFHANFIPKRDPKFDWTKPVDGSNPATDWNGVHAVDESPSVVNPPNGWLYNTNNWPWSAAGPNSPKKSDYPAYVDAARREPARRPRASACSTARRTSRSIRSSPRRTTAICRRSPSDSAAGQGVRPDAGDRIR